MTRWINSIPANARADVSARTAIPLNRAALTPLNHP